MWAISLVLVGAQEVEGRGVGKAACCIERNVIAGHGISNFALMLAWKFKKQSVARSLLLSNVRRYMLKGKTTFLNSFAHSLTFKWIRG